MHILKGNIVSVTQLDEQHATDSAARVRVGAVYQQVREHHHLKNYTLMTMTNVKTNLKDFKTKSNIKIGIIIIFIINKGRQCKAERE